MFKTRKLLAEILKNQREIKQALDPNVIAKAKRYDEFVKAMGKVELRVEKADVKLNPGDGSYSVIVTYAAAPEEVSVLPDGETSSTARFKAINGLNIVPFRDMMKISHAIAEAKRKNERLFAGSDIAKQELDTIKK